MLDEANAEGLVDERTATEAFDEAMRHEVAFWDVR
jgi:thiaminase